VCVVHTCVLPIYISNIRDTNISKENMHSLTLKGNIACAHTHTHTHTHRHTHRHTDTDTDTQTQTHTHTHTHTHTLSITTQLFCPCTKGWPIFGCTFIFF